jgi:hypothetical protein
MQQVAHFFKLEVRLQDLERNCLYSIGKEMMRMIKTTDKDVQI